jgi:hypothetical protein
MDKKIMGGIIIFVIILVIISYFIFFKSKNNKNEFDNLQRPPFKNGNFSSSLPEGRNFSGKPGGIPNLEESKQACTNLNEGDECSFEINQTEVNGICRLMQQNLICTPNNEGEFRPTP